MSGHIKVCCRLKGPPLVNAAEKCITTSHEEGKTTSEVNVHLGDEVQRFDVDYGYDEEASQIEVNTAC